MRFCNNPELYNGAFGRGLEQLEQTNKPFRSNLPAKFVPVLPLLHVFKFPVVVHALIDLCTAASACLLRRA
jgi:hypothetical protein